MTARTRHALLALTAALGLWGCRANAAPSARPAGAPTAPAASETLSHDFAVMRGVLAEAAGARARGGANALRQRQGAITEAGLALLGARMPHDLRRAWEARYIEGRAVFGEALKAWVGVAETGTDAEVLRAFDGLDEAFRGWVDASKGRAPERAV